MTTRTRYQPDLSRYYQLQHKPCGGTNCVYEMTGGWMLDAMTFGGTLVNGAELRKREGAPCGGSDPQHLDDLLARWYPPDRFSTGWFPIDLIKHNVIVNGQAFSAAVLYGPIADAGPKFSGQETGFRGWHNVAYTFDDARSAIMRGDPLCDGRRPTVHKGYSYDPDWLINATLRAAATNGKVHGSFSLPLWLPVKPTPKPPSTFLKYGAKANRRGTFKVVATRLPDGSMSKGAAFRHSPAIDTQPGHERDNVIATFPVGTRFYVAQSLQKKNGRIWLGNTTGDKWVLLNPRVARV